MWGGSGDKVTEQVDATKYVLGSDVISGDGGMCGEGNSDKDMERFLLAGS